MAEYKSARCCHTSLFKRFRFFYSFYFNFICNVHVRMCVGVLAQAMLWFVFMCIKNASDAFYYGSAFDQQKTFLVHLL